MVSGKSFRSIRSQELPRHLTPDWAGCGVSDKPATNHCFVSSHQCFEVWGASRGSAIIQLNSARENYSSVVAGASTIPPPQGINSQTQTWTHMPQHTPVHKIHTHASKQACTIAPALISFVSLAHTHKKKKTQTAQSPSDTDPHMISPRCSEQAGRNCSRRGNSVSVCSTEKREGKIGV